MTHASFIEWCKTAEKAVVDAYFELPGVERLGAHLLHNVTPSKLGYWAVVSKPKPEHQETHAVLTQYLVMVGVLIRLPHPTRDIIVQRFPVGLGWASE